MVVRITYQNQLGERHDLEWFADEDGTWTIERVVTCFKERYPTATFLAVLRLDTPCPR